VFAKEGCTNAPINFAMSIYPGVTIRETLIEFSRNLSYMCMNIWQILIKIRENNKVFDAELRLLLECNSLRRPIIFIIRRSVSCCIRRFGFISIVGFWLKYPCLYEKFQVQKLVPIKSYSSGNN